MTALRLDQLEDRIVALERRLAGLDPAERAAVSDASFAGILADAAYETGIPARFLIGPDRTRRVSRVRHAVCWTALETGDFNLSDVAEKLGNRDHTTILNSVRRGRALRGTDPAFRLLTDRLLKAARERKQS